jgi:hypothetical protein
VRNLFLTEADLACASPRIADRENGYGMTLAAVAYGAAGAVADDAVEQGATEDVGGVGEARDQQIASSGEHFLFH